MEEFIQEFKRAVRGSGYKGRPLVEEFKREMNRAIRRKLMEAENQPGSIEQWYKRVTALNRNWRESRREEERLREKKEIGEGMQKQRQKMINAMILSVAEEANIFSADNNGACSNGRSGENKCGGSKGVRTECRGSSQMGPLCDGSGLGKELLYLWGFWAHGLPL